MVLNKIFVIKSVICVVILSKLDTPLKNDVKNFFMEHL